MCEIPIESMKRMRIKKGDAVVLKYPDPLSSQVHDNLKSTMELGLDKMGFEKNDIIIFILDNGLDIEVFSSEHNDKIKRVWDLGITGMGLTGDQTTAI